MSIADEQQKWDSIHFRATIAFNTNCGLLLVDHWHMNIIQQKSFYYSGTHQELILGARVHMMRSPPHGMEKRGGKR